MFTDLYVVYVYVKYLIKNDLCEQRKFLALYVQQHNISTLDFIAAPCKTFEVLLKLFY